MSIESYKNYFRSLAISHKEIKHDPDCEGKNGKPAGRRFTCFSMDDVTQALRSAIGAGVVLHLHMYEWKLNDNGAFDTKGNYSGGFMVTKKAQPNNVESEIECYGTCETIVWQLIGKLYQDYQYNPELCLSAMGIVDWNSMTVVPTGKLWDERFGWWVEFSFMKPANDLIAKTAVDAAFE